MTAWLVAEHRRKEVEALKKRLEITVPCEGIECVNVRTIVSRPAAAPAGKKP